MKIVIPSYKRAKNCMTAILYKKAIIACHEFEEQEYAENNKENELLIIPDNLAGTNMAMIRNYILEHTDDEEVLMLDDDIKYIGLIENGEWQEMSEDRFYDFAENAFSMARELGTTLWGLNLQFDKKFYWEFRPFSFTNVVLGPCFGIIKDPDIRFDESLGLKEDYDYSIQVLRKHRRVLRFNKYHYFCGHITEKGGCGTYRTRMREMEQAVRFQKKWGSKIVRINRKTTSGNLTINPKVNVPIKGV